MKLALPMGTARKTDIRNKTAKIVKDFGKSATNTGSTEVQIALITSRINELTQHFQKHSKDHASRLGLLKLVGQRRRLLNYLKGKSEQSYVETITKLELRK